MGEVEGHDTGDQGRKVMDAALPKPRITWRELVAKWDRNLEYNLPRIYPELGPEGAPVQVSAPVEKSEFHKAFTLGRLYQVRKLKEIVDDD